MPLLLMTHYDSEIRKVAEGNDKGGVELVVKQHKRGENVLLRF